MKRVALAAFVFALALGLGTFDVEAKRLGGGGSAGMKRATPQQTNDASKAAPQAAPTQSAAGAAAAPAAAAAPKRSWMGPIAGLAAGLGIAALASHFGMGGALANIMTMVLLGVGAALLIGFLMRRFGKGKMQPQGGMQLAGAGAGAPYSPNTTPVQAPMAFQPLNSVPPMPPMPPMQVAAAPLANNDGFDTAGFEQIAKRVFIRLQAANDAGDQSDLRRFTTPEMYGVVQQELLDRKGGTQRTDVVQLDARVIERAEEAGEQIVSVRFWGLIREHSEAAAEKFDEVWHLVRPLDGSKEWAIAGIQPAALPTL